MFLILMCCKVQPLLVTSGVHQESCIIFLILRAFRIGMFLEHLERPSAALISDACCFSSSSISLDLSFMVEQPYVRMS